MRNSIDILYPPSPTPSTSADPHAWDGPERRHGMSTLEQGSVMLSHAVQYLVAEQFGGRRPDLQANREAIQILSRARIQLGILERREPARTIIQAKLWAFLR